MGATPNLATSPPPKDVVAAFIAAGSFLSREQALPPPDQLCSFRFADLRHDGKLSLVASADNSGRMFCNELYIVDKVPSALQTWGIGISRGAAAHDVSGLIKDVAGNGNLELVVPSDLTGYAGASHCWAYWPVVYGWTGAGYANVSGNFTSFYQQTLNDLNNQIAALPSTSPATRPTLGDPGYTTDCLKAEAAKTQRLLGVSSNAGLSQAAALAGSADPNDREFAADLLEDIGTPQAVPYLQTLSADPVNSIATGAQGYVANLTASGYQSSPPQPEQMKSVPFTASSAPK